MSDRVKIAQSRPTGGSLTDLYVCPANFMFAGQLTMMNDTAAPIEIRVALAPAGAADATSQYLIGGSSGNGYALDGSGVPLSYTGITLGVGDVIRVLAETVGVVFTLNGIERNI
jgi:hypothetical protein